MSDSKRPVNPAAPAPKRPAAAAAGTDRAKGRAAKAGGRTRSSGLSPEPAVLAEIRELESQLERLIDEAGHEMQSASDDDVDLDADGSVDGGARGAPQDAPLDADRGVPRASHASSVNRSTADPSKAGASSADTSKASSYEAASEDGAATFTARASTSSSTASATSSFGTPHEAFAEPMADSPAPEARPSAGSIPLPPESVFDTARELLSSDFYLRKWGRLAMRGRSEEVDDFGFDPIYEGKLKPLLDFLYTTYFRVETSGIEAIPASGRCLLVANHSGTLPLDGVMLKTAVMREHPSPRGVRWLTEDFIYHFPWVGSAMNRLGAVRACQENAERLLAKEQLVAVFPEGVKGIGKLFAERYRLQRFGRGGFIKLCLRTRTPIVPVAIVGAEETNPLLYRIEHLPSKFGVPYLPVTPTFPMLGPLGLLPAPTKWRIFFGEPLDLSAHEPSAADDEILVGKLAERVRASIQGMLDRAVGARKSVFFG